MSLIENLYHEYQELKSKVIAFEQGLGQQPASYALEQELQAKLRKLEQENQQLREHKQNQAKNIEERFRELALLTNMLEEQNATIEVLQQELASLKGQLSEQAPLSGYAESVQQLPMTTEAFSEITPKAFFGFGLHPDKWLEVGAELVCQQAKRVTLTVFLPKKAGQDTKKINIFHKGTVMQTVMLERGHPQEIILEFEHPSHDSYSFYTPEEPLSDTDRRALAFVLVSLEVA